MFALQAVLTASGLDIVFRNGVKVIVLSSLGLEAKGVGITRP